MWKNIIKADDYSFDYDKDDGERFSANNKITDNRSADSYKNPDYKKLEDSLFQLLDEAKRFYKEQGASDTYEGNMKALDLAIKEYMEDLEQFSDSDKFPKGTYKL